MGRHYSGLWYRPSKCWHKVRNVLQSHVSKAIKYLGVIQCALMPVFYQVVVIPLIIMKVIHGKQHRSIGTSLNNRRTQQHNVNWVKVAGAPI